MLVATSNEGAEWGLKSTKHNLALTRSKCVKNTNRNFR